MQFLKDNKWMIIGIAGAIAAVYVYFAYFSGDAEPLLTSTANDESAAVTAELLTVLSNLRSIRLDAAIFEDPIFVSLSDFGVTIPTQPIGRPNPFDPIGGASSSSTPR